jgi:glycerol kinase
MAPIVVSIDAGTTGVRAFLVDGDGLPVGRSYREFTQHFPRSGWVEHDPAEIWDTTRAVLAEAMGIVAEVGGTVAAVGVTDQRETVVAWDRRTGAPRHRAIVWQDRRTAGRCDALAAAGELDRIRNATGLVLDPYFSASKMEWLLTEGGVVADEDLVLGTVDAWLVWNLTGGPDSGVLATDPSNASRTMLYDLRSGEWSPELCDLFGVPLRCLPAIRPSVGELGRTVSASGLPAGVPVSGVAGDQQAALFGQACLGPGMAKNTYGTGSFVLMNVGDRLPAPAEGLLTTVAWQVPGSILGRDEMLVTDFALEGAIFVTGAAVQWLRDGLGVIDEAAETGPLAESVEDSAGAVVVPAFTGLGSPYWDPYARGTVLGISRGITRAHLARAVVESMAYQTRDVVEAMCAASGTELGELRVDGGAAAMDLLLRLQADQLGVPVARATVAETTALGAAYLAGLGAGVWSTAEEVGEVWSADALVEPSPDRTAADAAYATWQRAVARSRNWVTG